MPFVVRPYCRSPVQCPVTYNTDLFLKLSRAYCSGIWSLITLLVLCGPAYAEWEEVYVLPQYGLTVYLDPDTLYRKGDLVKMWELYDYNTTQIAGGKPILSFKSQSEYDCTAEHYRSLAQTGFSGNMGSGLVVYTTSDEGTWISVAPGSVAQATRTLVCRKQ
jgi:hypothetical protein